MSFLGQNLANLHIPSIGGIRKQFSKVSNPVVWRLLICKLSIIRPPSTLHSTAPFREIAKICGHVHVADSCCSNYSHRGDDTGHVAIITNIEDNHVHICEQNWNFVSWKSNNYSRKLPYFIKDGHYHIKDIEEDNIIGWINYSV